MIQVKPLLVLDLNGILCHRVRDIHPAVKKGEALLRPSIGFIASTPIIPRNDSLPFLQFLDRHFTLAVWTSATRNTARSLVNLLIPHEIRRKLLFVWNQRRCKVVRYNPTTPSSSTSYSSTPSRSEYQKPIYVKSLHKVWSEWPLWDSHNTLLMDDSPERCPIPLRNNSIHPPPLTGLQELVRPPLTQEDDAAKNNVTTTTTTTTTPSASAIQIGDVWNEHKQYQFFETLVKYWNDSARKDLECKLDVEREKMAFWTFLERNAKGHMGWRGSIPPTKETKGDDAGNS